MTHRLDGTSLEVFRKYAGLALPRHVSYPMPTWWEDYDGERGTAMLRESRTGAHVHDLSLYLHVPFCEHACRYCACTKTPQKKSAPGARARTGTYVDALEREIDRMAETLGGDAAVRHVHWGGGTPTYLALEQLERLHEAIARGLRIAESAEIAIELDARVTTREILAALRAIGFNRASLGVQDFDERVQEHVRRVQTPELIGQTVAWCRELGFASINFDLIYGLPFQTPATIERTIEQTIALSPDRIAFYLYAQIPDKIASQRGLDYTQLPDSETKLEMFLLAQERFTAAGYVFIGLDHFAKPDEGLAVAQREGTLQRNFQGMTTGGGRDLIGLGASSITHLAELGYLQNVRGVDDYLNAATNGGSPIFRGKRFTDDDRVRQWVLQRLYCYAEVQPKPFEARFGLRFGDYFARELEVMKELERDGLVRCAPDGAITVEYPLGRVLMRTIAAVFDAYLAYDAYRVGDRECFSANA